jgi:hypothetical protein
MKINTISRLGSVLYSTAKANVADSSIFLRALPTTKLAMLKKWISSELKSIPSPKKPMNAYMLFAKSEFQTVKEMPVTERMKEIAQDWKNLSTQDKHVINHGSC